jgi:hypothetical protein
MPNHRQRAFPHHRADGLYYDRIEVDMHGRLVATTLLALGACYVSPRPAPESAPPPGEQHIVATPTEPDRPPEPVFDAGLKAAADPPLLVADPPPPPPPAPTPTRVPAGGACLKADDPTIAATVAAVGVWTNASFERELARRGLSRAKLGGGFLELHRGIRGGSNNNRFRAGQVVDTTVDGVTGKFIAGPTSWSGSAHQPGTWELVQDTNGAVFRVVRNPLPSAESKDIVLCGCAPQTCGPYGSGCPACGSTNQQMFGPLPQGVRFRGEVRIDYPAAFAPTRYQQQTQCPPPRKCPAPPP